MKKRAGLVIGGVAAAAVLAGGAATALAASPGPESASGVITGCYTTSEVNGSHALVLQDAGTNCPRGTLAVTWNQTGPAGQNGTNGTPGTAGAAGTNGTNGSSVVTSAGVPAGVCNLGDTDVEMATGEVYTCVAGRGSGGAGASGAGAGKAGPAGGNAWSDTGSSIMGPAGTQGPPGPAGPGYVFTTTSGIAPPLTQDGTYYVDVQAGLSNSSSADPLIGSCNVFDAEHQASGFAGAFVLQPGTGATTFSFSGIVTVTGGTTATNFSQLNLGCEDTAGDSVTPGAVSWWVSPVSTSS